MIKNTLRNKSENQRKSQKLIITVRKFSSQCARTWSGFAVSKLVYLRFRVSRIQ